MAKTIIPLAGKMAKSGLFSGRLAFSDGVKVSRGEMVFVTGQLAFDEERELVGKGDVRVQTRQEGQAKSLCAMERQEGSVFWVFARDKCPVPGG